MMQPTHPPLDVLLPPFIQDWEIITSYAEAEEIIRSGDFRAGRLETESLPFRGDVLIELDGAEHRPRRELEGRLFSRAAIRHYEAQILDQTIERNLAALTHARDADGVVRTNLVDFATNLFLQIAASVIGLDNVDTPARTALLGRYFGVLDNAIVVKWSTRDHQQVIDEGLNAKQDFVRDFVAPSLARRHALIDEHAAGRLRREDLPMDLFTLMLLHPAADWDADLVHREAILYLSASIGSSSAALLFAVDELDRWLLTHPADRALIGDTAFLRRIVNESLRLRATFPAIIRWAARDTVLKGGRAFAAGVRVAIVNDAINRDASVFGADADRFNPNRVLPAGVHDYGLAFGTGSKSCIAKGLITTARESADGELDRALVKTLKAGYRAGLVVERDRGVERAPTAEVRFTVFPVRFDNL